MKNSGVEQIAANCTSLLRLGLAECRVKDRGLRKVLTCCGQLEHLDLSWCDKLTNTALTALPILPPVSSPIFSNTHREKKREEKGENEKDND